MAENSPKTEYRLNVFVAKSAGISRRKADGVIKEGRVLIDGKVVDTPGSKVDISRRVEFDGDVIEVDEKLIWVLMNKPGGYITTKSDPNGRPTVMDLLPEHFQRLFPVGRLDYITTGVLFFTNDGDTAQKMLHPKNEVLREYSVQIEGNLTPNEIELAKKGVIIEGRRAVPIGVRSISKHRGREVWRIGFCEGRYHEVRRFFAAIGHNLRSIERVSFAGIEIGGLKAGEWRILDEIEINNLKKRLENYAK